MVFSSLVDASDFHHSMAITSFPHPFHLSLVIITFFLVAVDGFTVQEATIQEIQLAFANNHLTSRELTQFYLDQIKTQNPLLRSVLEVNPDALNQADEADRQRLMAGRSNLSDLHGIPVMLKDSIGTRDAMNTTMGSYALIGAKVPRDATVVQKLRNAGAVILGKTSLSEWYSLRSPQMADGWCARGGQAVNPYLHSANPCGSSTGSAISVAANMVSVSLGTETDSSILCPSDHASVVGFKPTVGLTSRAGVVPLSARQDTIGPICRTVADAVYVLDVIVGFDQMDYEATAEAAKFIPVGGYKQFLKKDGLRGKRLGIVRNPFLKSFSESTAVQTFEDHLKRFMEKGAILVDNLEIPNIDIILNPIRSGEMPLLVAEFGRAINNYLAELIDSPVKSLAEVIAFNKHHYDLENLEKYNQDGLVAADKSGMTDEELDKAVKLLEQLSLDGFEKLMKEHGLDAMVTLGPNVGSVMAIGGYPAITVPAGYDSKGMPFGLCFGGLRGSEPILIEIAYSFEQDTQVRRPPVPSLSTPIHSTVCEWKEVFMQ